MASHSRRPKTEIGTYNGRMANCIRFDTQGRSYVIGYSYEDGAIQVRANRQGGRVLERFDNDSTAEALQKMYLPFSPL